MEVRETITKEASINVGDTIQARWTNSGRVYSAKAEIVKVNYSSFRIRLVEPPAGYAVGQTFSVPRFSWGSRNTWSNNNRVVAL